MENTLKEIACVNRMNFEPESDLLFPVSFATYQLCSPLATPLWNEREMNAYRTSLFWGTEDNMC